MALIDRENGALISGNGVYRHRLWRTVGPSGKTMLFVMLNPSTADATTDDRTIGRCIGFAQREGCGRLEVVNLYDFRSTDPDKLITTVWPPASVENAVHIGQAMDALSLYGGELVFGWGAFRGPHHDRLVENLLEMAWTRNLRPMCLGTTRSGAPRHPLYLASVTPLRQWHRNYQTEDIDRE